MALTYQPNGNLEPGIHEMQLDEFIAEFNFSRKRKFLLSGLQKAINAFKSCGITEIFIDGSFVTTKDSPGDYDACYYTDNLDLAKLKADYPCFFNPGKKRVNQKFEFGGEFFAAKDMADFPPVKLYIDFFQQDKNDNSPKGIVKLKF